ncbi:MAG: PHB depolymerase family esterase [Granulosicoccus sp.]|nr:PHB depolymerase family esterase [Granulosicoccus sp.]
MYLHRPAASADALPLVVALHGCRQTAIDFGNETGLMVLAEETPFLLLLPEQRESNMPRRCFRWYDTSDNRPGRGESASIMAVIDHLIDEGDVDPSRVYVLGLSAGGAMTVVLMSNYPSRFAGGAVFAGLPYGCNRPAGLFDFTWHWLHLSPFVLDGADASYACGIAGFQNKDRDADQWAEFITQNSESLPERWPLVSLWQGTGDATVDPDNLSELTEQWTVVQAIDSVADDQQIVGDATREIYHDEEGNPRVETWSIQGYGHAVPIDADGDPDACGMEAAYIVNADLCAVRRVADFWQLR